MESGTTGTADISGTIEPNASVESSVSSPLMKSRFDILKSIPFSNILLGVEFVVCFILFCVFTFIGAHPSEPKFLVYELIKQSSFVYIVVQLIGLAYYAKLSFIPKDPMYVVPPVVAIVVYLMTVAMGYAQTSSCDKPKRNMIFTQALKPAVLVIAAYFMVVNIKLVRQGFYDILSGGEPTEVGMWVALSFWMAAALYPSVSSAYFTIQQYSCSNDSKIEIGEIAPDKPKPQII